MERLKSIKYGIPRDSISTMDKKKGPTELNYGLFPIYKAVQMRVPGESKSPFELYPKLLPKI